MMTKQCNLCFCWDGAHSENCPDYTNPALNQSRMVGAAIITERSKIRGAFTEQARVSQNLKHSMRDAAGWDNLPPAHKEALDNIANKMARLLTGDPNEIDSWADISGYAELILKEIRK